MRSLVSLIQGRSMTNRVMSLRKGPALGGYRFISESSLRQIGRFTSRWIVGTSGSPLARGGITRLNASPFGCRGYVANTMDTLLIFAQVADEADANG